MWRVSYGHSEDTQPPLMPLSEKSSTLNTMFPSPIPIPIPAPAYCGYLLNRDFFEAVNHHSSKFYFSFYRYNFFEAVKYYFLPTIGVALVISYTQLHVYICVYYCVHECVQVIRVQRTKEEKVVILKK